MIWETMVCQQKRSRQDTALTYLEAKARDSCNAGFLPESQPFSLGW